MSTIDATLAERGSRYGEFADHAEVTQSIKDAMKASNKWATLPDDMLECLEMVAHKIGRILNGDPDYIDSWTDIIGYTRLVEKRLIAEQAAAKNLMSEPDNRVSLGDMLNAALRGASPAARKAFAEAEAAVDEAAGMPVSKPAAAQQCHCPDCDPAVRAALDLLVKSGVVRLV